MKYGELIKQFKICDVIFSDYILNRYCWQEGLIDLTKRPQLAVTLKFKGSKWMKKGITQFHRRGTEFCLGYFLINLNDFWMRSISISLTRYYWCPSIAIMFYNGGIFFTTHCYEKVPVFNEFRHNVGYLNSVVGEKSLAVSSRRCDWQFEVAESL